jgi:uncharacterized alkaline shock family protein YloU
VSEEITVTSQNAQTSTDLEPVDETKAGTLRIAPDVLATIAALTAQSVPGVVRLEGGFTDSVGKIIARHRAPQGVKISVVSDEVWVELHIICKPDVSLYQVGREVQDAVAEAIETMVGMPVHAVDVHIEDVE